MVEWRGANIGGAARTPIRLNTHSLLKPFPGRLVSLVSVLCRKWHQSMEILEMEENAENLKSPISMGYSHNSLKRNQDRQKAAGEYPTLSAILSKQENRGRKKILLALVSAEAAHFLAQVFVHLRFQQSRRGANLRQEVGSLCGNKR